MPAPLPLHDFTSPLRLHPSTFLLLIFYIRFYAAFAHDLPLGKGHIEVDVVGALEFINMLCEMFVVDHKICLETK